MTTTVAQSAAADGVESRGINSLRQAEDADRALRLSDAEVRKILNAFGIAAPIVAALLEHPGPRSDYDSTVAAAREMMQKADEAARELTSDLGATQPLA